MKLASFLFGINSAKLSPFHDDIIYNIDFVGEKADLNIPGSDRKNNKTNGHGNGKS